MTTIAYDNARKSIAVDGRCTGDGIIKTDEDIKYLFTCDQAWFFCGQVSDYYLLLQAFNGEKVSKCDSNALLVIDKQVYLCGVDEGRFWKEKVNYNCAIGSGYKFALAAMDFGKSAKEAVEYAATRDTYTGGKIFVFDINTVNNNTLEAK